MTSSEIQTAIPQPRKVAVLVHPTRSQAVDAAVRFTTAMAERGVTCFFAPEKVEEIRRRLPGVTVGVLTGLADIEVELVVVLGGDGTLLASAQGALAQDIPLLGVNLGHVGFLAELESYEIDGLADRVARRDYTVEERLALQVEIRDVDGALHWSSFAVNEVSVEKLSREKMIEVLASVDQQPLSRWGADGVLVSTPSGSTAYAFSAGGPVMWPDVEAILLVPVCAHALFAGPLVLSQRSRVDLELSINSHPGAVVWCDGHRSVDIEPGAVITVHRHPRSLKLARLSAAPFTSRLVRKFELPINGWRVR